MANKLGGQTVDRACRRRQNLPETIVFGPHTEPPLFPAPTTLDEVRPLDPRPVVGGTRRGKLWNEFIARYHYLGYKTLVGAQMRYAVHDRDGWPLAMLGVSTAAWKLVRRDNFIGWTPQQREKNLPLVVDNPRFLILPWITIPNLGSHILALVRRRLPEDWTERCQHHARTHRDLRRDPAIHQCRLPGFRLAPCRNHARTRALRSGQAVRQAQEGRLAQAPAKRLEAHPQPVESTGAERNIHARPRPDGTLTRWETSVPTATDRTTPRCASIRINPHSF